MKKTFVALLVLLIPMVAFASGLNSFEIGTGNDLFGLAANDNFDDQLSFNGHIKAGFDNFDLSLVIDAYTQRYSSRVDVGLLTASKDFQYGSFSFTPHLGLAYVGKINMEKAQNLVHSIGDYPFVHLEYENISQILPAFELSADYKQGISENLFAFAGVDSSNVTGLYTNNTLKAGLGLSDVLSFGAGYRFYRANGKSTTLEAFEKYNNGPVGFINIDTGFVSYNQYVVAGNGFGFGTVAFDFGAIGEKKTFEKEDMALDLGFATPSMGKDMPSYKYISVSHKISDKTAVYVSDMYDAGCGVFLDADKNHVSTPTEFDRNNRKYCFVTAGACYDFPKTGWLRPSVQMGAGFCYAKLQQLSYSGNGLSTTTLNENGEGLSPVLEARVSVNLLPSGLLEVTKSDVNAKVFAGIYFVPGHEKIQTAVKSDNADCEVGLFVPYWGFAGRFGVDY